METSGKSITPSIRALYELFMWVQEEALAMKLQVTGFRLHVVCSNLATCYVKLVTKYHVMVRLRSP